MLGPRARIQFGGHARSSAWTRAFHQRCAAAYRRATCRRDSGTWAAHLMFAEPIFQLSNKVRSGTGQWAGCSPSPRSASSPSSRTTRHRRQAVPASVALYIVAAYWFTSSTGFANPAITMARALSDTFAGIAPADTPAFIAAQLAGACVALVAGQGHLRARRTLRREPGAPHTHLRTLPDPQHLPALKLSLRVPQASARPWRARPPAAHSSSTADGSLRERSYRVSWSRRRQGCCRRSGAKRGFSIRQTFLSPDQMPDDDHPAVHELRRAFPRGR